MRNVAKKIWTHQPTTSGTYWVCHAKDPLPIPLNVEQCEETLLIEGIPLNSCRELYENIQFFPCESPWEVPPTPPEGIRKNILNK